MTESVESRNDVYANARSYTTPHLRSQLRAAWGAGVIWNGDALEPPVIPAKAGIQSADRTFPKGCGVDSRFRGND